MGWASALSIRAIARPQSLGLRSTLKQKQRASESGFAHPGEEEPDSLTIKESLPHREQREHDGGRHSLLPTLIAAHYLPAFQIQ
jgi:hypothetical protein